ncbi:protein FAM13A-like [Oscarella lobularis]|uniref:protein FAM13A-like n=1 Tax=Oscarella lobularis TaxID=121494 RepID=UPI0033144861
MKPPLFCGSPKSVQTNDFAPKTPLPASDANRLSISSLKRRLGSPLSPKRKSGPHSRALTFGVALDELMRHATPGSHVPRVVETVCEHIRANGLDCEGIFRVSGNQKILEKMRVDFDKTGNADLKRVTDVPAVASLLKQFLRELPIPVVPDDLKKSFMDAYANNKSDRDACAKELKRLVPFLPASHFQLLKYICKFLIDVAEREDRNKMGHVALAIVFGPNLFRLSDGLIALQEQAFTNGATAVMIQCYDEIFGDDGGEIKRGRKKPDKPLPFAEHVQKKKKKKAKSKDRARTLYDEEEIVEVAEMTVAAAAAAAQGSQGFEEEDSVATPLNHTLMDANLEVARDRRRRQRARSTEIQRRPLPPDPPAPAPPKEDFHKALSADNLLDDDDDDEADGYAKVEFKTRPMSNPDPPIIPKLVLDPVVNEDALSPPLSQVDHLMRSGSPWSLSSGAPSPQPAVTPRRSLVLRSIVRETVSKHLFANENGRNDDDDDDNPIANLREVPSVSGGEDKDEESPPVERMRGRGDHIKGKISAWEKRIVEERTARSPSSPRRVVVPPPLSTDFLKKRDEIGARLNLGLSTAPVVQFVTSPDDDAIVDDDFVSLPRNATTGLLTSLTANRAPPPKNRRRPMRRRRNDDDDKGSELVLQDIDEEKETKVPKRRKSNVNDVIVEGKRQRKSYDLTVQEYDEERDSNSSSSKVQSRKSNDVNDKQKRRKNRNANDVTVQDVENDDDEKTKKTLDVSNSTSTRLSTTSVDSALPASPAAATAISWHDVAREMDADLSRKRSVDGRSANMDEMTLSELRAEKQCVQRTLLAVERRHGRPTTLDGKEATRWIYNRYREIKMRVREMEKLGAPESGKTVGDVVETAAEERLRLDSGVHMSPTTTKDMSPEAIVDSAETSIGSCDDVLKSASTGELEKQLATAKRTKRALRDVLKAFETRFEKETGRRVGKADRGVMEEKYVEYKKVKSSIKLLSKLLGQRVA